MMYTYIKPSTGPEMVNLNNNFILFSPWSKKPVGIWYALDCFYWKNYDRPRVLGCEPVDGVLVVFVVQIK